MPEEAAQASPPAEDSVALPDILVRGEKFVRRLEETTSSVQVLTAEDIANSSMDDIYDAYERLANVNMDMGQLGKTGGFVIRGITSIGVTVASYASSDPLAAIYVDGVPLSSAGALGGPTDVWDLESIEVFRGPQSTNQGQSALAGAIVLRTRDPGDFWDLRGRYRQGDFGHRQYSVAAGGPVWEGLGVRIAHQQSERDGSIRNITRDEWGDSADIATTRLKLGWQSKEPGQAALTLSGVRSDLFQHTAQVNGDPRQRQAESNDPETLDNLTDVLSLQGRYLLSERWELSSATGYSQTDQQRFDDYNSSAEDDGTIENLADDASLTQELRLSFGGLSLLGAPLRGVLGAYASHRRSDGATYVVDGDVAAGFGLPLSILLNGETEVEQSRRGWAVFGESEWDILPRLTLITGLRYDQDKVDFSYVTDTDVSPIPGDPLLGDIIGDLLGNVPLSPLPRDGEGEGDADSRAFLPKLGLRYALSPDISLGLVAQQAYRSGGLSVNFVRGTFNTFEPEYTDTAEIFFRSTFWERRARLSLNAFYTHWKDQQVEVFLSNDALDSQVENAGSSYLYGGEMELNAQLWPRLSAWMSVGYVRTEFLEFESPAGDYRGNEFPSAPRRQAAIGLELGSSYGGPYAQLDLGYQSRTYRTAGNQEDQYGDARALLNARVGWRFAHVQLFLTGRNLLDRFYLQQFAFDRSVPGEARTVIFGIEGSWE